MRRAHVMMEVLVVLTLLMLAAGVTYARLHPRGDAEALLNAIQAVRADLQLARSQATLTGLRHSASFLQDTGELTVEPFHPEDAQMQAQGGAAAQQMDQAPPTVRERLPNSVRLETWQVSPLGFSSGGSTPTASSVQQAFFYPEGYSDSVTLVLASVSGERRGFELDGYSGSLRDLTADELGGGR